MLTIINKIIRLLPPALCFILIACSKINQENFTKVQPGMTMAQVVNLLGEPNNVESLNFAGLSGTSAVWKTKDTVISIQFLNDLVQIKSIRKVDQNGNNVDENLGDNS